MDLTLTTKADLSEMTAEEVRRIVVLWNDLRGRFGAGGPFLVGAWSIADAFYTPVATRFRSYGIHLSDYGDQGAAGAYAEALLATRSSRNGRRRRWPSTAKAAGGRYEA